MYEKHSTLRTTLQSLRRAMMCSQTTGALRSAAVKEDSKFPPENPFFTAHHY